MILNAPQVGFLQRLVAERPARRRYGDIAIYFSREYGIGRVFGRSILYSTTDWDAAARMLQNHNIPRERSDGPMRRAETAGYVGISEKAFGSRPHGNAVAVRSAFGACTLGGQSLGALPDGAYMVLRIEDVVRVQCQQLIVVENLETFRYLSRYQWIQYGGLSTLAIYRGDTKYGLNDASEAVAHHSARVLAFTDFDPAGLFIASQLPRLARLVLPELDWLRDATIRGKRHDLYSDQIGQYAGMLESEAHFEINRAFMLLGELRAGYAQEWMERAPRARGI
ncbi:DUF7281 domain-containing protein [Cupriavidus plantarum]|uniref:DUF7281 domain-containing protein n=1 Tax=Cupriavidus plantarum TaxID=942865 RepID=UPI000E3ACBF2|nr:hypothetical protein [Cupriavidus plantarum]REE93790.1 hypothetical protein C7418_2562 [Cupriavidus plantarum]